MKNTMALFGVGLASFLISTSVIAQKTPDAQGTKKTSSTVTSTSVVTSQKSGDGKEAKTNRHIKLTKIENGKKMELDTIFTNDDVFVWNGDTINPMKHVKSIKHSGSGKMYRYDVEVNDNDGKENVMIYKHNGVKEGEPLVYKMESDGNVEVFTTDEGDSVQKKIIVRKMMKDGKDKNNFIYLNGSGMKHFPPMPAMPRVPQMKVIRDSHAGRIIDLNDPNIISYKKKKLSGDREKIEIVRKKSEGPENMNFDFQFDNEMMAPPPPPPPPAFIEGSDNYENGRKIIRKEIKVDEKNDQKIKKETPPQENK